MQATSLPTNVLDTTRVVVMGGSAGSIASLQVTVGSLPADFPGAILIVVHLSRHSPSVLDAILRRSGPLPCTFAEDGEDIEPGHIYVAPPNQHLVVNDHTTQLVYGPRQNLSRPAIDPLFRSAAEVHGSRVIGILLSGILDDGTQGLIAVKQAGGITVVQDPDDALYADMPETALRYAEIDYAIPARQIGKLLTDLVHAPVPKSPVGSGSAEASSAVTIPVEEAAVKSSANRQATEAIEPDSKVFVLTCPECGGPLSEVRDGETINYRCIVGHGYSAQTLRDLQSENVERALWTAYRVLQESVAFRRRMIERIELRARGEDRKADLEQEIAEAERDSDVIRRLLYAERK